MLFSQINTKQTQVIIEIEKQSIMYNVKMEFLIVAIDHMLNANIIFHFPGMILRRELENIIYHFGADSAVTCYPWRVANTVFRSSWQLFICVP